MTTVWLAVFAIYVQLLAAIACTAGSAQASGAAGAFPICHHASANAAGATTPRNDGPAPPQDQQSCPFCSIHCHATLAASPALDVFEPLRLEFVSVIAPAPYAVRHESRLRVGAPPRGPPSTA